MRSGRDFHSLLMSGVAAVGIMAMAPAAQAAEVQFNIPAQSLETALAAFSAQSLLPVLATPAITGARRTSGVVGAMEPAAALDALLQGTGLTYRRDGGAYLIVPVKEGDGPQAQGAVPGAQATAVDELIVTAQKKAERIQDVPIAISAFSQQNLDEQKVEGGSDLLKAIPNVTFSKNNFTGYNFSIRGIGTKAVSATTDPAVAVSFNNTTLMRNRLFEQEYFDVERVEVLRGPQGTLYGRNATGGVVNMITAKPTGIFEGELKAEVGNFDARRLRGFVNIPLADGLAVRLAGSSTERSGFGTNLLTGNAVDGRDLWSGRMTVGWEPNDRFKASLVWEHFEEDDNRARTGKQLCHRDPGPTQIGNFTFPSDPDWQGARGVFSQGCVPGSLYDKDAFGMPNSIGSPYVQVAYFGDIGIPQPGYGGVINSNGTVTLIPFGTDPFAGRMQSRNMREIETVIEPVYRAKADILQFNLDIELMSGLTLSSQTAYNTDEVYSTQDYNRFNSAPLFNSTSELCDLNNNCPWLVSGLAPGGFLNDPQLGKSNTLVGMDLSKGESTQFSQEFRLQSSFDGPLNFSAGANYTKFEVVDDYYVFFNTLTAYAALRNATNGNSEALGQAPGAPMYYGDALTAIENSIYIDPNSIDHINGRGHNYFRSQNPYKLVSSAVFGELYWQATDTLKFTGGLRYTDDRKTFTPWPSQTLEQNGTYSSVADPALNPFNRPECHPTASDPNAPPPPLPPNCLYYSTADVKQHWGEVTGRFGFDWKPELSFTDQTMVYAFYSHGYKGGGANPPSIGGLVGGLLDYIGTDHPQTFDPEFVDAFEVGAKNALFDGSVILNGSAFYYDYKDYQVSQIVDRIALNENFDATVWGLELEAIWRPTRNFRINANLGYLDTRIADGEKSIDPLNRTQGHSDWVTMRPWAQFPSNCIAPVAAVEQYLSLFQTFGLSPLNTIFTPTTQGFCGEGFPTGLYGILPPYLRTALPPEANGGRGFDADLSGNELPNSPHWTFNIGAQYTWDVLDGWNVTLRGDYYRQSDSYARVYNSEIDELRGWQNANLSLVLAQPDSSLAIEVYAKNLFDDTPITDTFLNSDDTGLTTNVFVLDPRLIGISVRKGF
jgi:iron complex outermembrane receptor protein